MIGRSTTFAWKQKKAAQSAAEGMEKNAKLGRMADQSTPHERTISPAQCRPSTAKADHSAQARLRWLAGNRPPSARSVAADPTGVV